MSIYIKLNKQPNSIKELLKELFSYIEGQQLKSTMTYKDSNCKIIECYENKYRSIDAVVEVCQTYFSNLKDEEIIKKILFTVIERSGKQFNPYLIQCNEIQMPTLCFISVNTKRPPLINTEINRIYPYSKYKSWENILNIIGFNQISYKNEYIRIISE